MAPKPSLNLYTGRKDVSTIINTYCSPPPTAEATEYYRQ